MAEERRDDRTDEVVIVGGVAVAVSSIPQRGPIPLDDFIALMQRDIERVTRRAAAGEVTIMQWEAEMRRIVKSAHNGAAMFARQGQRMNIFERLYEWARRQERIRDQFGYLEAFANEIRGGVFDESSMLGRLVSRAQQYGNAARGSYFEVKNRLAIARGLTEKRRMLEPGAKHCQSCLEQAALEWVDINDPRVTGIGETQCGANDKCDIVYR